MISRIWLVSGCGRDYSGVSMSEEENRKPRVGARATQTSAHDFRASLRSEVDVAQAKVTGHHSYTVKR